MSQLIVNADDFGLTAGINRAIGELHEAGLLTSATLMARAAATDDAIRIALATPALGVGCHVVLVDGEPALPASCQMPHLMDPDSGAFHTTLSGFLQMLARQTLMGHGARLAAQIEAETEAQIALLQAKGLRLTHIDTHKHVHMFPAVLRPVLSAARRAGITAVRNPFEPAWSAAATPGAPWLRRAQVRLLTTLAPSFHRIVQQEGCITTRGALGVLATGTLDAATVRSILQRLPSDGVYELVAHPGYNDADLAQVHTRLRASRELERDTLAALAEFPAVKFTSFASLPAENLAL